MGERRILDTFKPEGLAVTPAFAAYMIEHGYRTYLEAQDGVGFALWQAERWEDFWIERGGDGPMPLAPTGVHRARWLDWLDQRAVDHIARNKVEAAA